MVIARCCSYSKILLISCAQHREQEQEKTNKNPDKWNKNYCCCLEAILIVRDKRPVAEHAGNPLERSTATD